jgi:hypothetical protein
MLSDDMLYDNIMILENMLSYIFFLENLTYTVFLDPDAFAGIRILRCTGKHCAK